LFHLQGIDDPTKSWKNLEAIFGKHDVIQAHEPENQLMTLNPNYLSCIEYYLSNFKTPRLLLKEI
jgi:hypothetical protein